MSAIRNSDGRVLLSMQDTDAAKIGWLLTLVDYEVEEGLAELGDAIDSVGLGPDADDPVDVAFDRETMEDLMNILNNEIPHEEVQQ